MVVHWPRNKPLDFGSNLDPLGLGLGHIRVELWPVSVTQMKKKL